ncbi:MAG: D-alanyl-D-alanine carboxypeptidase family protein [Bacillota bacterium]|nr:D-alanyl-D-alanine carboxypeptidase family protein [Bacillota bacterium]
MKRLILSCTIALLYLAMPAVQVPAQAAPAITGEAAVLMDLDTGQVLYTKNADRRMYPASTTKILTALTALEQGRLEDVVTTSERASLTEGSSVYLKIGERQRLKDLLYALMVNSGNDCAVAIAEHIAGSEEQFVDLMNDYASRLGATHSHFANPHGLHDPQHYTTARDLAVIAREAMKNPTFRKIVATRTYTLDRPDDKRPTLLVNRNRLLWTYDGCLGVKTGYTSEASQCLVAAAERNGQRLLSVVLKSQGPALWTDSAALLDYGFMNFPRVMLVRAGQEIGEIPVPRGAGPLRVTAGGDFAWCLPADNRSAVSWDVRVAPDLEAPVARGEQVGTLVLRLNDRDLGHVPLKAANAVEKRRPALWMYVVPPAVLLVLLPVVRRVVRRRRSGLRLPRR